jgi:putative tricarboxylic transport membrane protein
MAQSMQLKGDAVSGVVLAALGAYIVSEAWRWDYSNIDGPGPGFFPLWYGMVMVVLSLALVVRSVMRPWTAEKAVDWHGVGRALSVWAVFTASIVLMKWLGFLMAFGLLILFVVAMMYGRPLKVAVAVAAGNMVVFYLLFTLALQLNLPVGPLGF